MLATGSRGASPAHVTAGQQSVPWSLTAIKETRETMRKFLFIFAFFFVVLPIRATDLYIAQSATGGSTGADCGDALPYTFFNNSANWPSPIGPGTTVHLCGTFTAAAGTSNYLVTHGSGSSSSPITILFENGAVIQAPYWSGAVISVSNSYITVNGGTNGTIQATANGTKLANQQDGAIGVNLVNASNVMVENLTIANLYVRTCTPPVSTCTDENGSNTLGITAAGGSNLQFENNTVHDLHWSLGYGTVSGATINIQIGPGNNVYNTDHGVFVANTHVGSTLTGIYVYGNHIHDFQNWDDAADDHHHDAFHTWSIGAGTVSSQFYVYNNLIDGQWGQNDNAGIYWASSTEEAGGNVGQITNCYTFNNILNRTGGSNASGAIADYSTFGCVIVNNTIYTDSIAVQFQPSGGATLYNNIGISQNRSFSAGDGGKIAASDYNDLYTTGGLVFIAPGGVCCVAGLADWISATGFDTHTITRNPNLMANYVPSSGSPVTAAGKNLSNICSGQSSPGLGALCFDAAGNPRSSTGNWDMGANSVGNGAGPSPPTNVTVTVQ